MFLEKTRPILFDDISAYRCRIRMLEEPTRLTEVALADARRLVGCCEDNGMLQFMLFLIDQRLVDGPLHTPF